MLLLDANLSSIQLTSMQSAVLAQEGVRVLPFPYENGRTPNETFLRLENIVDRLNVSR